METNLRVTDLLPYLLIALGVLLYLSPLAPLPLDKTEDFLVLTAPHYVVAGLLTLFAARGRGDVRLHMVAAPVVAFAASAGMLLLSMLLIPEPPAGFGTPPYWPEVLEIIAYSVVSLTFSLGIAIRARKVGYVGMILLVYVGAVQFVAVRVLNGEGGASLGEVAGLFIATVVPFVAGLPLGVVGYLRYGKYERTSTSNTET
jgi:hypothetical protein